MFPCTRLYTCLCTVCTHVCSHVCTHVYSIHMSICICLYLCICTRPIRMSVNICMHMSVRSVARMLAAHMRSAYTCTCMRARKHARMHARTRARAQACDALHPYNVQGRAQAKYKDVREQHTRTCASNAQGRARACAVMGAQSACALACDRAEPACSGHRTPCWV